MALIRFPQEPEFDHPQHLWNEQEFIIRMLHQHKIGIGIIENNTQVTVTIQPGQSLNMVANGAVEFDRINNNLAFTANTNRMGWIYLAADGSRFYLEPNLRPAYNQYLHGWYRNNGDRAILFIDHEAPAGSRAMLMDSFNAHFEHEQRIPMQGGELFFQILSPNNPHAITLDPGSYRFELMAGRGGSGGGHVGGTGGGTGAYGQRAVLRINIYARVAFSGVLGGNGSSGENGRNAATPTGGAHRLIATGGGGGASGHDSRLWGSNGSILSNAIGGAGGGGSAANPGVPIGTRSTASPGGGGAGYGIAGAGSNSPSNTNPPATSGASPGTLHFGGQGGPNRISASGVSYTWGQSGQHRPNTGNIIRRGGNSGTISGFNLGPLTALGGTAALNSSSGFFRVFRIRAFGRHGEIS